MLVNVYIRRTKTHILIILLVFAFQNLSKSHFWTKYAVIFSHNCIGKKNRWGISWILGQRLGITQILPVPSCGQGKNCFAGFPTAYPRARAIFGLFPRAAPMFSKRDTKYEKLKPFHYQLMLLKFLQF